MQLIRKDQRYGPAIPEPELMDGNLVTNDRQSSPKGFTELDGDSNETVNAERPRTAQCACCGVTSTLPELFLKGSVNQHRTGLLCPKCFAWRSELHGKWFLEAMCLTVLVGGLLWARGLEPVGLMMAGFACGAIFTALLTPLHEVAHALTALALGMSVHAIEIGWFGRRLFQLQVGRCLIEIKRVPLGGLTYVSARSTRYRRLKEFLVVAAGPALHIVLLALACWIVSSAEQFGEWSGWVAWLAIIFGLANAFEIAINLWPRRIPLPFGEVTSDGLSLCRLPFVPEDEIQQWGIGFYYYESLALQRQGKHAAAIECLQEGLARYQGDFYLRCCYAAMLIDEGDYDKAARIFEAQRENRDLSPEHDALLLNNIAWADVSIESMENLERARNYSQLAIDALPWDPAVKGVRGSVLLASGDLDCGTRLLKEAFAENDDPQHRACNAAFLALGAARAGRLDDARDWHQKAERFDPNCRQLQRARREIDLLASADATSCGDRDSPRSPAK